MENLGNPEKAVNMNDKDQNSSKESDVADIIFEKTVSSAMKPQALEKKVNYICLDDSDSDNIEASCSGEPSKLPTLNKEVSKNNDYLNLESSDTDDEQVRIQNDVSNLLSSAAILNDIESGPAKINTSITLPTCTDDVSLCGQKINSPASAVNVQDDNSNNSSPTDIYSEKVCSQEDFSDEKIESHHIPIDTSRTKGVDPRIYMYRKDNRIISASKEKGNSQIPSFVKKSFTAHDKAISSLDWSAIPFSHLLLSSSWDSTIKIWDIYSQINPIMTLGLPFGVRTAKWLLNGETIVAGGFGKEIHVIDALSGLCHTTYKIYNNASCIAIHPFIEDVILCGTNNAIYGFDLRVDSDLPVRFFVAKSNEVLDIAFINENEFASSNNIVSNDSADRTIMVWDFGSGAIMSNQIFLERYTCPSLKMNSFDSSFIAQTNGNYIASFSTQRPYKIQNKRYVGHKVSGFGIECDISRDGQYVASGDANGDVYFYKSADAKIAGEFNIKQDVATNKLQWHPVLPSTMAVATWDGQIHLCK